jgi:hypothetical protein
VPPPLPRYELRIRGRLSDAVLLSLHGMRGEVLPDETIVSGPIADRVALHRLLDRIQALGLELIAVRRLPPTP